MHILQLWVGLDVLVFTGERSAKSRYEICSGLEFIGVNIDVDKNETINGEGYISTDDSKVKVLVIPTNEEIIVARETARIINNLLV